MISPPAPSPTGRSPTALHAARSQDRNLAKIPSDKLEADAFSRGQAARGYCLVDQLISWTTVDENSTRELDVELTWSADAMPAPELQVRTQLVLHPSIPDSPSPADIATESRYDVLGGRFTSRREAGSEHRCFPEHQDVPTVAEHLGARDVALTLSIRTRRLRPCNPRTGNQIGNLCSKHRGDCRFPKGCNARRPGSLRRSLHS
jgi:hypothetical protein